jgi:hypothetical protein
MTNFRDIIEREDFQPYVIHAKGGRSYAIAQPSNAFITEAYPDTVILAVRGQGISLLGLDAIESIQAEHEAAAAAR